MTQLFTPQPNDFIIKDTKSDAKAIIRMNGNMHETHIVVGGSMRRIDYWYYESPNFERKQGVLRLIDRAFDRRRRSLEKLSKYRHEHSIPVGTEIGFDRHYRVMSTSRNHIRIKEIRNNRILPHQHTLRVKPNNTVTFRGVTVQNICC